MENTQQEDDFDTKYLIKKTPKKKRMNIQPKVDDGIYYVDN